MPQNFLTLASGNGSLLLANGSPLLLASSTEYEAWMLYNLDSVEGELKRILEAVVGSNVQVLKKRETVTDITPRVELVLTAQGNNSQRWILNPGQENASLQPFNVWNYQLSATIVTNRETNGSQHAEIVGKVRGTLQKYKLNLVWDWPLHTIIEIVGAPDELSVSDEENCDETKMNFTGMLSIKDGAWALVS